MSSICFITNSLHKILKWSRVFLNGDIDFVLIIVLGKATLRLLSGWLKWATAKTTIYWSNTMNRSKKVIKDY